MGMSQHIYSGSKEMVGGNQQLMGSKRHSNRHAHQCKQMANYLICVQGWKL